MLRKILAYSGYVFRIGFVETKWRPWGNRYLLKEKRNYKKFRFNQSFCIVTCWVPVKCIQDIGPAVAQRRIKCPYCSTIWTIRVQVIGHGRQRSDRLITMGLFVYMLGLSCRAMETFLLAFEWKGSKRSVERDVTQAGQKGQGPAHTGPGEASSYFWS